MIKPENDQWNLHLNMEDFRMSLIRKNGQKKIKDLNLMFSVWNQTDNKALSLLQNIWNFLSSPVEAATISASFSL